MEIVCIACEDLLITETIYLVVPNIIVLMISAKSAVKYMYVTNIMKHD